MGTSFDASRLSGLAALALTVLGVLVIVGTGATDRGLAEASAYLDQIGRASCRERVYCEV